MFQTSQKKGDKAGGEAGETEDSKDGIKKEQLGAVGLKTDQYAKQLAAMKVQEVMNLTERTAELA